MSKKGFEMKKVREGKRSAKGAKGAKNKKAGKPGRKRIKIAGKKKDALLQAVGRLKTNKKAAADAGISEATFYRLMQHDPVLKAMVESEKEKAVALIEVSVFQAAHGFEYEEITKEPRLVVTRQRNGQKENVVLDERLVVTNRVNKLVPPNPKLAELIVYNWLRKQYKNRSLIGMDPEHPMKPPTFVFPGFKGGLKNGATVVVAAVKK